MSNKDDLALEEQLMAEVGGRRHEWEWIDPERKPIDECERKKTDEHVRRWMEAAGGRQVRAVKSDRKR